MLIKAADQLQLEPEPCFRKCMYPKSIFRYPFPLDIHEILTTLLWNNNNENILRITIQTCYFELDMSVTLHAAIGNTYTICFNLVQIGHTTLCSYVRGKNATLGQPLLLQNVTACIVVIISKGLRMENVKLYFICFTETIINPLILQNICRLDDHGYLKLAVITISFLCP